MTTKRCKPGGSGKSLGQAAQLGRAPSHLLFLRRHALEQAIPLSSYRAHSRKGARWGRKTDVQAVLTHRRFWLAGSPPRLSLDFLVSAGDGSAIATLPVVRAPSWAKDSFPCPSIPTRGRKGGGSSAEASFLYTGGRYYFYGLYGNNVKKRCADGSWVCLLA